MSNYYELMEQAYEAENFAEAYEYAKQIIDTGSDKAQLASVWVYRGWSAGRLSTPNRSRLKEMRQYIEKGIQEDGSSLSMENIASHTAWIIYWYNFTLLRSWSSIAMSQGTTPVRTVYVPSKSMSENIGAGLGAGIAQGMITATEQKRIFNSYLSTYINDHLGTFVELLNLTWNWSSNEATAQNIFLFLNDLINCPFPHDHKLKMLGLFSPLVNEIQSKYPNCRLDEIKGDGCAACFIATAVMGDENDPNVVILRAYRDQVLLPSSLGRTFVKFYYRVSPPIANIISKSNILRKILLAILIQPAVFLAGKILANKSIKQAEWI